MFSNSASRAILSEIANWLDRELRLDADIKGQPALERNRTIEVVLTSKTAHVSAVYEVLAEDRLAKVRRLVFRRA